jgi:hypothetical protein
MIQLPILFSLAKLGNNKGQNQSLILRILVVFFGDKAGYFVRF